MDTKVGKAIPSLLSALTNELKLGRLASNEDLERDMNSADWLTVRYKRNRATFADGDLPHLATKITQIHSDKKRVILGFNCFTSAVSECCLRAPEHSDAFNRTVKLYQSLSSSFNQAGHTSKYDSSDSSISTSSATATASAASSKPKATFSAKDILKKPALAKLLVSAARKLKENQQACQSTPPTL